MPAALPIVATAAFSATSLTAAGALAFSWSAFALSAVSSIALSAVSRALAPKPKSANIAPPQRASTTQNVRQSITSHQIVYGQRRVGGPITFISSSNGNEYLHIIVTVACHEITAIDEVWLNETVIPNDALDVNGNVTSGRYSGYVRIKKYLGTPTQGADAALMAECPEWTTNHRQQGRAYIYARLRFNQDIFPSGIPNISAVLRGKKIVDPRDDVERFTTNNALYSYDYMADEIYGLESLNSIDIDSANAAANVCDEFVTTSDIAETVTAVSTSTDIVTLSGSRLRFQLGDRVTITSTGTVPAGLDDSTSDPYYVDDAETDILFSDDAETDAYEFSDTGGTPANYYIIPYQFKDTVRVKFATSFENALAYTAVDITSAGSGVITVTKNAEPRYHGAGVLTADREIGDNLLDTLSGWGGKAVYAGGVWKLLPPVYATPTVTLDEDDFASALKVSTSLGRRDRFNQIKGVFTSSINDWQPSDYPAMTDDTAVTADGQVIFRDYDLPFTNREFATQRLAKIEVLKATQDIVVKARCNLRAMQIQVGDTVYINNTRLGWSSKVFEVTVFRFINGGTSDEPDIGVELTLRETAAAIFDWATSEESDIDISPNTNLPNAFDVEAVTGVAFSSRRIESVAGDFIYALVLQWTASSNAFVLNDGRYEIQYKISADADWRPSFFVTGEIVFADVQQASVNTSYDLRIRAINNLGVRSSWVTILGAVVGSSGGVGSTEDRGLFSDTPPSVSEDWGLFSDTPPTTTEDWEYFT